MSARSHSFRIVRLKFCDSLRFRFTLVYFCVWFIATPIWHTVALISLSVFHPKLLRLATQSTTTITLIYWTKINFGNCFRMLSQSMVEGTHYSCRREITNFQERMSWIGTVFLFNGQLSCDSEFLCFHRHQKFWLILGTEFMVQLSVFRLFRLASSNEPMTFK